MTGSMHLPELVSLEPMFKMRRASEQFPLTFATSKVVVVEWRASCSRCNTMFDDPKCRCTLLSTTDGYRTIVSQEWEVETWVFCRECMLLTVNFTLVHDDGSLTSVSRDGSRVRTPLKKSKRSDEFRARTPMGIKA